MQFTATIFATLAFIFVCNAAPQGGLNQPIFNCDSPDFGGCCKNFLPAGPGVSCSNATVINDSPYGQWTCNDNDGDIGQPACCHIIAHSGPAHIGIPLPCVAASY